MIFCTAKDGIAVGAERCWKYLKSENIPCLFYISKTDEDHGDFAGVLSALRTSTAAPSARSPRR